MLRATRGFDQGLKILIHIFIQKILDKLNENAEVMLVTSAFFMLFWIFGVKGRYKRSLLMLNLAMFFGYHLLWPEGFAGAFDARSALIAIGAAVAWCRHRRFCCSSLS